MAFSYQKNNNNTTVFLCGEVSSGKSSLLNAIAGGFISSVSLQRETFNPQVFHFSQKGLEKNLVNITNSLSEISAENKNHRDNSNCGIMHEIIDNADILPINFKLDNLDIIDFPGINDSHDTDGKYLSLIEKHIHLADIILYVTESKSAMTRTSEIDLFKKIQSFIKSEDEKCHYIKLVIAVNKFDNQTNADINEIFDRISSKIGVDPLDIYKISSHKLLIDSLIHCKKNLIVPPFMRKEVQEILQNCNVLITKTFRNKFAQDGIIEYTKIEYGTDLDIVDAIDSIDSDGSMEEMLTLKEYYRIELMPNKKRHPKRTLDEHKIAIKKEWLAYKNTYNINKNNIITKSNDITNTNIKGDWSNLILYLTQFPKKFPKIRHDMMYNKIDVLIDTIVITQSASDLAILSSYYGKLQSYGMQLDELFEKKMKDVICYILDKSKSERFYLLDFLFRMHCGNAKITTYIISLMMRNLDKISFDTKIMIYKVALDNKITIDHNLAIDILKNKLAYSAQKVHYFDIIKNELSYIDINIVASILEFSTDKLLKKIVKISLSECTFLNSLMLIQEINKNDLIEIGKYIKCDLFHIKFALMCSNNPNAKTMYHELFKLDDNVKIKEQMLLYNDF